MAPLARPGFCALALIAVGVVHAAGVLASTSVEHPVEARREVKSSGSRDHQAATDNKEGSLSADQVRAGLRGSLESLKERANGTEEKVDSAALGEALSEAAAVELAAVALSSINTFWVSLTPAARSELLQELGSSHLKSDGEILIVPSADDEQEEEKDESDSEKEEKEAEKKESESSAPSSSHLSRGSGMRQLREDREDSALLRVLQRLGGGSRQGGGAEASTTSTSTLKPLSSTTIAVSAGSSTIEIEAGVGGEDLDIVEYDFGTGEQQKKYEEKSLAKIHEHLAELDLDEADILLAFRAFIRRYSRFLGAYKERLIAFVDSEEFSNEVAKLKGAIREHDMKHGIKKQQHEDGEKHHRGDEKKHSSISHHHGDEKEHSSSSSNGEHHQHQQHTTTTTSTSTSSPISTSTVAIEGVPTTMVAIGASTTTTTVAPEDVSTTLIATLLSTAAPITSTSTAPPTTRATTTTSTRATTRAATRAAVTAAPPRL